MISEIRDIPKQMAGQKADNKKDLYIELTNKLLKEEEKLKSDAERQEYVDIINKTLENMDFQIYELYRSLQDAAERQQIILAPEVAEKKCDPRIKGVRKDFISGLKLLKTAARVAVFQIPNAGKYNTTEPYDIYVNGKFYETIDTVVFSVYDLEPMTQYTVEAMTSAGLYCGTMFTTEYEYVTINVRDTGAKGDGVSDDTVFIQASILACPRDGRVLIPAGDYLTTSIFLKSNISIELAEGARIIARTDREAFARFPGRIQGNDPAEEYLPGTWEGNPLPMFAGILTGYDVENVFIYGKGVLDGGASRENWWNQPKVMNIAYRPRLFFIHGCSNIVLQGITLKNSPSWTIHPFFSDDLGFYNVTVNNPSDSPNTDGLDPESCKNVEIAGVKFSLGDDCIAVKSGKIYMGKTYQTPSENIRIHHCLMENGHGAVTIGSEMAGGVKNLSVEDCDFIRTDRGLRIKTRRGRGRDAILDQIAFRRINMDNVMTPFVVNCFYFCDPDGKTPYVQTRETLKPDDRLPEVKTLIFEDIDAKNCHVAATHFDGIPEKKIEKIVMKNVKVGYSPSPKSGVPAMSEGVEECTLKGIFARNVKTLILDNVSIIGQTGNKLYTFGVDDVNGKVN